MPNDFTRFLPEGLTPFTEEEVRDLRLFAAVVAEIDERAVRRRPSLTIGIVGHEDPFAEVGSKDELIAVVSTFRKLAWNQGDERITFDRVRNTLSQHAKAAGTSQGDDLVTWLKYLKKIRRESLRTGTVFGYALEHTDSGSVEHLTPEDALDLLINGGIAHTNPDKRERWDQMGGWNSVPSTTLALVTVWETLDLCEALGELVATVLTTPALLP